MKKTVLLLCSIIAAFTLMVTSFSSCTKGVDTTIVYRDSFIVQYQDTSVTIVADSSNKQTYVRFLNTGLNTTSIAPVFAGTLPFFNKNNYVGTDSVIFVCSGYNYGNSGAAAGSFVADLFDVTDNVPITGSSITVSDSTASAGSPNFAYHVSPNILSILPPLPITLAVRITSSSATNNAVSGDALLLIYK